MYTRVLQGWMKHWDFILLDILCLHFAYIVGFFIYLEHTIAYSNTAYLNLALFLTLMDLGVAAAFSTFKNVTKRGYYLEFAATLKHVFIILVAMALGLFLTKRSAVYSRVFTGIFFIIYTLTSYLTRIAYKKVLSGKKSGRRIMMVVSTRDLIADVLKKLEKNNNGTFTFIGIGLTDGTLKDDLGTRYDGIEVLAVGSDISDYLCKNPVDEVFLALPEEMRDSGYADVFTQMGIPVHSVIEYKNIDDKDGRHRSIEKVGGYVVLTTTINTATLPQMVIKRTVDIIGSLVGLVITLLITVFIGPVIYFSSPGPIFFSQERVGRNGRKFKLYKFRSMYPDAEKRKEELKKMNMVKGGMMFKVENDPRIIGNKVLPDGTVKKGIGAFIRERSLDEFPQFLNVLKGDMSLVGTRPPTVDEYEKYRLHHRARLAIKPGITGLWQVSGRSRITDFEKVVELDKQYIHNWNMGLDIKIMLATIKKVLTKDGAK